MINSRRRSFYFSASTQFSNAGDALINRELLHLLRAHGDLHIASAGAPCDFLLQLDVDSSEIKSRGKLFIFLLLIKERVLERGKKETFLVLTPGDPRGKTSVGDVLRCALFPVLKFAGVKVMKIGASISRMDDRKLSVESWISRWMFFYGLRDSESINRAGSHKFGNFGYFPDLAFNLPSPEISRSGRGKVVIAMRNDNLDSDEESALIETLEKILNKFDPRPSGAGLVFVSQVERDHAFARKLCRHFGDNASLVATTSLDILTRTYGEASIVLSNRLHAILLSATSGAIPLCITSGTKNRKISELLRSVGLDHLVYHDGTRIEVTTESLLKIASVFSAQKQEISSKIATLFESFSR